MASLPLSKNIHESYATWRYLRCANSKHRHAYFMDLAVRTPKVSNDTLDGLCLSKLRKHDSSNTWAEPLHTSPRHCSVLPSDLNEGAWLSAELQQFIFEHSYHYVLVGLQKQDLLNSCAKLSLYTPHHDIARCSCPKTRLLEFIGWAEPLHTSPRHCSVFPIDLNKDE